MKLSNPVEEDGLIEKITEITSATIAVYTNKSRIANLNNALDQYWFYAAESAPQGTLDDTNNDSAPIETVNLVEGTNAYKMSAFNTSKDMLQILRMAALTDEGDEFDLIYEDFEDIRDFEIRYSTDSDSRGTPFYWTKLGDFIYISATPDYNEANGLVLYTNRELSKFSFVLFTTTNATNVIDSVAHGLSNGNSVILETDGTMPNGFTADTVVYYVINKTDDTFQISLTVGGSAVTISDDGSGNHKYTEVSKKPGIPVIHHDYLARYAADQFMNIKHPKFTKNRADLIQDKINIQDYWQSAIRQGKTIISTAKRIYK